MGERTVDRKEHAREPQEHRRDREQEEPGQGSRQLLGPGSPSRMISEDQLEKRWKKKNGFLSEPSDTIFQSSVYSFFNLSWVTGYFEAGSLVCRDCLATWDPHVP